MKKLKKIFLIVTLPIVVLCFSNCGGTQESNKMSFTQNPPFKISESYFQDWVAGVKEGGSGTNIHLNFSEKDPDVVIQNIFFRNQILEAKGNINEPNHFVGYLINEVQRDRDVVMDKDPLKEAQNTLSNSFPFQLLDNEAVIEYWFGGTKNYFKISNISKKDMIPYPQSNPNVQE